MTAVRPPLPTEHANPRIPEFLAGAIPPVKYQVLTCQGNDILVGRLKVDTPTPSGHAFILRRFDTGAVSLTTIFRAAFPTAPEDAEKREVQYIKERWDLSGQNGSSRDPSITRLAGTWVPTNVAIELGKTYSLGGLIQAVVDAQPDPKANYRRSGNKSSSSKDSAAPASSASRTVPSPKRPSPAPPAAKRRKESSPAPAPASPVATPRRSTRTKSPTPVAPMPSLTAATKSIRKTRRRQEPETPGGSDETAVDEEGEALEVSVGTDLREQDMAEQRDLIEKLKAQRNKAVVESSDDAPNAKRAREDEDKQLEFDFKEPEIGERVIATNRRISPSQKSVVWGVMAFAFGMTAVSFLPSLF